jgi:hypothetical protein
MKKILLLLNIFVGLALISMIGIKHHPEYNERTVIVKHRPSLDFVFHSPIGDSDKTLEDLSPEEKEAELLYQTYIKRPNARTIDNVALVLFQIGVYLIVVSLLQLIFFRRKYRVKIGRALTINILALAILLGMYQIFWTQHLGYVAVTSIQVILNIGFIFPFLRKNK